MAKKSDKTLIKEPSKTVKKPGALLSEEVQVKEKVKAKEEKKEKGQAPSEVRALTRYLRISPKKVRLVANAIRGLNANEALDKMSYINKKATLFVIKTLNSAIANAENNFKLKKDNLYIKKIVANEGPALHRWEPRAFGRAAAIKKRTTHLEIVLSEKIAKPDSVKNNKIEVKNKFFKKSKTNQDKPLKERSSKQEKKAKEPVV